MKTTTQERLFPLALDESKLGKNQQAVLAWIDRWGGISPRVAGRIVYRNRGHNVERIDKEWLAAAGYRVLISLRRRGLVRSTSRKSLLWIRTTRKAVASA